MAKITANFGGVCAKCGGAFSAGATIEWERGKSSRHVACPEAKLASAADATISLYIDCRGSGKPGLDSELGKIVRAGKHDVQPAGHAAKALVVLTQRRSYQSEEDNEDMGDMRGGGWSLTLGCRLATPEEEAPLLVLEHEERAQRDEATRIKRERRDLAALFGNGERPEKAGRIIGEEIPIDTKGRIHGGGSWFVVEGADAEAPRRIWYVLNNGHDGDSWADNNVQTGGAGAIGRWLPWSAELDGRCRSVCEGGPRPVPPSTPEARRLDVLRRLRAFAVDGKPALAALFADDPSDYASAPHAVWVDVDGARVGLTIDESLVLLLADPYRADLHNEVDAAGMTWTASRGALHFAATAERVTAIKARWPAWVGTSAPGRFVVGWDHVADNAADALRVADREQADVASIKVAADAAIVYLDPCLLRFASSARGIILWSDGHVSRMPAYGLHSTRRHAIGVAADIARRDAAGEKVYDHEREWLTGPDRYLAAGFPELPEAPQTTRELPAAAAELVKIAVGSKDWREGRRFERLFTVASESREQIGHRKDGRSSSGEEATAYRVTTVHGDGRQETLGLLHTVQWSMGEDADVCEDDKLFESEAAARAAFQEFFKPQQDWR